MTWRLSRKTCRCPNGTRTSSLGAGQICKLTRHPDCLGMRSRKGCAAAMAGDLILAPETEHDMAEAYAWYERQRLGLGEEFMGCVDAALQAILRTPEAGLVVHEHYRRKLVRRFPYA